MSYYGKTQALCSSQRGPTQDATEKGDNTIKRLLCQTSVLFLPVLGREGLKRMVDHPKPKAPEQRSKTSEVQDGYSPELVEYAREGHQALPGRVPTWCRGTWPLADFLKSAGRMFPRRCRPQGQEISRFLIRQGNFSNFRSIDCSQDVQTPGQSGRSIPQDAQNKRLPIPR